MLSRPPVDRHTAALRAELRFDLLHGNNVGLSIWGLEHPKRQLEIVVAHVVALVRLTVPQPAAAASSTLTRTYTNRTLAVMR